MTPSGIEPVTCRLVARHLDHCATAVPLEDGRVLKVERRITGELALEDAVDLS